MRSLFLTLTLFLSSVLYGQQVISGKILDETTGEPVPFAAITLNETRIGTSTDIDGKFDLQTTLEVSFLNVRMMGYASKKVDLKGKDLKNLEIFLTPQVEDLKPVEIVDKGNPAWEIIRKVERNRMKNNPENLPAFQYHTYNKLYFTLEYDSARSDIDTVNRTTAGWDGADSTYTKVDSTVGKTKKFFEKTHLFMMESVTERKYLKPGNLNETVLANRISGLQNQTFTLLATQMQSFSFYGNYIEILEEKYLSPLAPGFEKNYIYILQDTLLGGADTTFVIKFLPMPNPKYPSMSGVLYVTSDGWAVSNVIATPQSEGLFKVQIKQKYEKREGVYFPLQHNYDIWLYGVSLNGGALLGVGKTYLKDIEINPPLKRKEFDPVALLFDPDMNDQPDEFWEKYRGRKLDAREERTYELIDSIGEEENFDKLVEAYSALTSGKVRVKKIDIDLDHIMRYNVYEGFRLGFGAHTNDRLSKWFSIGGYFGYGFGDKAWKYGYDGKIILNKKYNFNIGGGYQYDIAETGDPLFALQRPRGLLGDNTFYFLWIEQFDWVSNAFGYVTYNPLPNLHSKVTFERQNRNTIGAYYFQYEDEEGNTLNQNGFNTSGVRFDLSYAPNDEYAEGKFGRKPISLTQPVYHLSYYRSFDDLLGSQYAFDQIQARMEWSHLWVLAGETKIRLEGGMSFGDLPSTFQYYAPGTRPHRYSNTDFLITNIWGFETMKTNEFLANRFGSLAVRHNFHQYLFRTSSASSFYLVGRAYWGDLVNPEQHYGLEFQVPDKGYFEVGAELKSIFNPDWIILNLIGAGVYYRVGEYAFENEWNNLFFKLSLKTDLSF